MKAKGTQCYTPYNMYSNHKALSPVLISGNINKVERRRRTSAVWGCRWGGRQGVNEINRSLLGKFKAAHQDAVLPRADFSLISVMIITGGAMAKMEAV